MSNVAHDIVSKLWNLCNILKDDGVTYYQYVNELTYLLFLKMARENGTEEQIPAGHRWDDLTARLNAIDRAGDQAERNRLETEFLQHYHATLVQVARHGHWIASGVFENAGTVIRKPATLAVLVREIGAIDWFSVHGEAFGDLYEGLLQRTSAEGKSGAGQYFTPRPLIDSMVAVMRPTVDDRIQDPAAGTGGFLIAADRYIRQHGNPGSWTEAQRSRYERETFFGMEHVQDTYRLALMNLMLHGINSHESGGGIQLGDTLGEAGQKLCKQGATLILANPPFGSKRGGGLPSRTDLDFPTSNKQFCFLQHIYRGLAAGGRAAVVLPDNVLFEANVGKQIRGDLMDKCNLHTILRLPTGIFYAQGVKTNVLFFTRGAADTGNTNEVWVYDLRANMPSFGKRNPLTREHFAEFGSTFGDDPRGRPESLAERTDAGDTGRFRRFSRQEIADRGDNLDIAWLKGDDEVSAEDLPEPESLIQEAMVELGSALGELRGILDELGEYAGEEVTA